MVTQECAYVYKGNSDFSTSLITYINIGKSPIVVDGIIEKQAFTNMISGAITACPGCLPIEWHI